MYDYTTPVSPLHWNAEKQQISHQQERNERIGRRYKGRPAAEVAKDVRELLDEALKILRDAGPQVVGARGFRASR